jgi:hypothetical protein
VGYRLATQDVSYGGGLLQRRTREDHGVPMEVALQWPTGVVTRYRGQVGWGEGTDPTGVTERTLLEHGLSVESPLAGGGGLAAGAVGASRISFQADWSAVVECRTVTGGSTCVDFIDQLNRGVSVMLETVVSDVEVGAQVSLVDRRSFTGLMTGFTQFQVGVWGRMVFEAGPIERLGGGGGPF